MLRNEKAEGELGAILLIGGIVVVIVALIALFSSIASIDVGEGGVVFNKQTGVIRDYALTPGWQFVTPFVTEVIHMETRIQKEQVKASAASSNLQTATTDIALNYYVRIDDLPWVYQNLGLDYKTRYVDQAIQDSVKAATAQFMADELITKRETVRTHIEQLLREKLNPKRIQVDAVSITNFEFSPEFQAAIEQKQTAAQLALKAENDLNRIKVEAEQIIAKAGADAKAIEIKGKALKDNPALVQLEWVYKWNGVQPQFLVTGTDGNTPTLLVNVPTTTK